MILEYVQQLQWRSAYILEMHSAHINQK